MQGVALRILRAQETTARREEPTPTQVAALQVRRNCRVQCCRSDEDIANRERVS